MNYHEMNPGQKAAFTRRARIQAQERTQTGYRVAELMLREDITSAAGIASNLGITNYQARGYMARVTAGDFADCRLS